MGLIAGLILGAILGVVADRLWFRYERIPKLDIVGGESMGVDGEGYHFTITNRGILEIPPYKIYIYHPCRGSISFSPEIVRAINFLSRKLCIDVLWLRMGNYLAGFQTYIETGIIIQ